MSDFNNKDFFGFDNSTTQENTGFGDNPWGENTEFSGFDTPQQAVEDNVWNTSQQSVVNTGWGAPENSFGEQSVGFESPPTDNSGWGNDTADWGATPTNGSEFFKEAEPSNQAVPNTDWGQTTESEWNATQPQNQFGAFDETPTFMQEQSELPIDDDNVNLSGVIKKASSKMTKKTGLIILAVVLLLVALLTYNLAGAKIVKKPTVDNTQQQVQTVQPEQQVPTTDTEQQTTDTQQEVVTEQSVANTDVAQDSVTEQSVETTDPTEDTTAPTEDTTINKSLLIEIPAETTLNYDGDVFTANGIVGAKQKYLYLNQVVYCIPITITVGDATQTVNYFCNYGSFSAVKEGDLVVVEYQQVADGYISVTAISK